MSEGYQAVATSVIGLDEASARNAIGCAGLTTRVAGRDDVRYVYANDSRPDRINITITDGKITEATIG